MRKAFCLIVLVFGLFSVACGAIPKTSVTVTVVNEAGDPIEGAHAQGVFPYGSAYDVRPAPTGYTNEDGIVELRERAVAHIGIIVEKEGYYLSRKEAPLHYRTIPGEGRNEYFDVSVQVVLREIRDPVPMYAGAISTRIPEFRDPVGFDLQRMDWVRPYGEGQEADVFFTLFGDFVDADDFDMQLRVQFPGEGNGIIVKDGPVFPESALKSPYKAPLEGYRNEWALGMRRLGREKARQQDKEPYFEMERDKSRVYIFRIRADTDVNDNVFGGHYGKIYGDFDFGVPIDKPAYLMGFTIYLNPEEEDRNLEFDPNRNLADHRIVAP